MADQENNPPGDGAVVARTALGDKSDGVRTEFVAKFLDVDATFVTNLPAAALQKIAARANELEELKSQNALIEMEFSQSAHNSKKQLQTMQERMNAAVTESNTLKSKASKLESEKNAVERELHKLKNQSTQSGDQIKSVQSRLEQANQDKRQNLEALDRRNVELRELRVELEQSKQKNLQLRKETVSAENELQQSKSAQLTQRLKEQQLTQEVQSLKRSNEWLDSELAAKSEELKKFRADKLATISSLTTERDNLQIELSSFRSTNETLTKRAEDLNKKYDSSLVKLQDLKTQIKTSEDAFAAEMSTQQRLAELWEKSAKDAKARINELEKLLAREREASGGQVGKWKTQAEKEKKRAARLEAQLQSLEKQLEDMHGGGATATAVGGADVPSTPSGPHTPVANRMSNFGTPMSGAAAIFSPSAKIISEIQRGGGSLVQLYSDFQETKTRLERERYKNESLRREMDNILEEMENHAPAILAEREENRRLEIELAELSVSLEKASVEADRFKSKLQSAETKLRDSDRENSLMQQQMRDLSRQVQHLLIQIQMLADNEPPLNPQEHAALQDMLSGETGESDTDRLISERLTLFKNIIEMQTQNEQLLKATRELGRKMEAEEHEAKKKIESLESEAVERAKEAILQLQEDLRLAKTKAEALQRERDMFRRMTQKKDDDGDDGEEVNGVEAAGANGRDRAAHRQIESLTAQLSEAKQNLEVYKTESQITIRTLNEQISLVSAARSDLQLQVTRVQGQCELANDRFKNLQDNMEAVKQESSELKKRNTSLQESMFKQEYKTQQVTHEIVECKSLASSLQREVDNLKGEKRVKESIHERLTKENADLLEERERLNRIVVNLQAQEADRSASDGELRQQLKTQIESLNSQLAAVQKKLDLAVEEKKHADSRREMDGKEYQMRIDTLNKDLSQAREEALQLTAAKKEIEAKAGELQVSLNAAQDKLLTYTSVQGGDSTEAKLTEELATTKADLERVRHELVLAEQNVKEITDVARAAEETLQSFGQTHDEFQERMERELADKQKEIEGLEARLGTTSELMRASDEKLLTFQDQERQKLQAANDAKVQLESRIKALESSEQSLLKMQQEIKNDLSRQAQVAKEAQDNYEKELVKHAQAADTAQKLRAELGELQSKILSATSAASAAEERQSSSEASWTTQKYAFEHEIEQLKSRCSALAEENKQMLEQLETATTLQTRAVGLDNDQSGGTTEHVESDEVSVSEASDVRLKQIIRYLKQEKEIVEISCERAQQESRRYKQQLDHTTTELDHARLELERVRSREDESIRVSTEHQKVLQQLNDINILRESNAQLRSQQDSYIKRAEQLETQVAGLEASIEPLQDQLRESQSINESHELEVKQYQTEIQQWKDRVQNVLGKYERIDPAEFKSLQDQVAALKQQIATLQAERDALVASKNELASQLEKEKAEKAEVAAARDGLSDDHELLKVRFEKLLSESKDKLSRRATEARTLRVEAEKLRADNARLEQVQAQSASTAVSTDAAVATLQTELAETKKLLEEAQNLAQAGQSSTSTEADQAKIAELQSVIDGLTKTCEELRAAAAVSGTAEASGDQTTAIEQLTAQKNELEQSKASLEASVDSLRAEIEQIKSSPESLAAMGPDAANQAERLAQLKTEFDNELNKVKAQHEADKAKEIAEAKEATKKAVLSQTRDRAQQLINDRVAEKTKELELKYQNAAVPTEGGAPDAAKFAAEKAAAVQEAEAKKEAEKIQAVKEAEQRVRKETDMRLNLLQKKLAAVQNNGAKPATAAGAQGAVKPSGIPAPARSIQIKGQEAKNTAPPTAPSGATTNSRLPRGGGTVGGQLGRGGLQKKPGLNANRPSFHPRVQQSAAANTAQNATSAEGQDAQGQKRPAANAEQQNDAKRQKP